MQMANVWFANRGRRRGGDHVVPNAELEASGYQVGLANVGDRCDGVVVLVVMTNVYTCGRSM